MHYTAASFPIHHPWSMQFLIAYTPAKQDSDKAWYQGSYTPKVETRMISTCISKYCCVFCRYETSVLELAVLSVFCAQQGAGVYCCCCVCRVWVLYCPWGRWASNHYEVGNHSWDIGELPIVHEEGVTYYLSWCKLGITQHAIIMNQGPWLKLEPGLVPRFPSPLGRSQGMRQASSRLHHATAQSSGWVWIDESPATDDFHISLIHFIASYFMLFSMGRFWFDIGDVWIDGSSLPQNDLRSTLNLIKCLLQQSKDHWLPPWFKPFLKRLFFLAVFAAVFLALRLQLMKSTPMFPAYVSNAIMRLAILVSRCSAINAVCTCTNACL